MVNAECELYRLMARRDQIRANYNRANTDRKEEGTRYTPLFAFGTAVATAGLFLADQPILGGFALVVGGIGTMLGSALEDGFTSEMRNSKRNYRTVLKQIKAVESEL